MLNCAHRLLNPKSHIVTIMCKTSAKPHIIAILTFLKSRALTLEVETVQAKTLVAESKETILVHTSMFKSTWLLGFIWGLLEMTV